MSCLRYSYYSKPFIPDDQSQWKSAVNCEEQLMVRRDRPETAKVGIIYLVRYSTNNIHKIGVTLNWERRSRQLSVGVKVQLVLARKVLYPGRLERDLHHRFQAERVPQSEWFNLNRRQVRLARQAIEVAHGDYERFIGRLDLPTKLKKSISRRTAQHPIPIARPLIIAKRNRYSGKIQSKSVPRCRVKKIRGGKYLRSILTHAVTHLLPQRQSLYRKILLFIALIALLL